MLNLIRTYVQEIDSIKVESLDELEQFRIKFLSKKGLLAKLFDDFKKQTTDKQIIGKEINLLKKQLYEKYALFKARLTSDTNELKTDLTLPAIQYAVGNRHPVSLVRKEIIEIFSKIGFTVYEGLEIEDDWHVFTGLNFPPEHPARDMQDTFFIHQSPDILLRTHTSPVQVRAMENEQPPIRMIFPGRVFRNEAISARSHCIFHQVEGLYINNHVSFADLKQTLYFFVREFFGNQTSIRLRPSFFPFTEPSAELDVSCTICNGSGCNVCKYTGFLEILGCGMVDPNVLDASNIDSTKYKGFAFGMGIERIAMLRYQINDIRLFFENDIRFLSQFKSVT